MSGRRAKQERRAESVLPFRSVDQAEIMRAWTEGMNRPLAVFQSSQFLAAIYKDPTGFKRLTVNRVGTKGDGSGRWDDDISWDTLQEIKSKIGLGDVWAVEVYPADDQVVNVANMRHLFLFPEAPPFAWRKS